MLRIMWCRNALARKVKTTSVPRRSTDTSRRSRTGDLAWHCASRKALKSCSPARSRARLLHERRVQAPVVPAHAVAQDRRRHAVVEEQVVIGAREGAIARVELRRHLASPEDACRLGKVGVGSAHPRIAVAHRFRIEVHDLRARMHARVRAARCRDFDGLVGETRERGLQVVLDSAASRLGLPAAEGRAVVLEAEGDAQAQSEAMSFFASSFWAEEPSFATSCRISRAPSLSPISR